MDTLEQHEESLLDPLQVVRTFLECCAHKEYRQASYLLDDHVQVSYPGLPFIKSNTACYGQAIRCPSSMLKGFADDGCWVEAPHAGAHAGQVVRRIRSRHGTLIEVFEVSDGDDDVGDHHGPRIAAMYLRKAPGRWASHGHRGGRHRIAQRTQQQMLRDEMDDEFQVRGDENTAENLSFRLRKGNFVY